MHYGVIAIISALFFVLLDLIYKFTSCSKIDVDHFVCLWFLFGGLIALVYFFNKKYYEVRLNYTILFIILIIAIITFAGNMIYLFSIKNVSNPGLVRAIYSGTLVGLLTLITALVFKKFLTQIQMLAIILIMIGIFLLLNYSE